MKLKNKDLLSIVVALQSLDGARQPNGDGLLIVKPYKFGGAPGAVRYRIARNLRSLRDPVEAINEQRETFAKLEEAKANADWRAFLATDAGEFDLLKIPFAELNSEENGIPGSVIEALLPILEGEPVGPTR